MARLYRPVAGLTSIVVYLHGGGWTIGGLESHDRMCRRLAYGSGVAVLAVDYRLAPEHPWPASVDNAVAVLRWVASRPAELGEEMSSVAVAGDSAGGTLAALACLRLRDESEAYARRLRDAGVDVELRGEPGLIHNFMLLDELSPACAAAADRVADDLRVRLGDAATAHQVAGRSSRPSAE